MCYSSSYWPLNTLAWLDSLVLEEPAPAARQRLVCGVGSKGNRGVCEGETHASLEGGHALCLWPSSGMHGPADGAPRAEASFVHGWQLRGHGATTRS